MKKKVICCFWVSCILLAGCFFVWIIKTPHSDKAIKPANNDAMNNIDNKAQDDVSAIRLELSAVKEQLKQLQHQIGNRGNDKFTKAVLIGENVEAISNPDTSDIANEPIVSDQAADNGNAERDLVTFYQEQTADDNALDHDTHEIFQDAFSQWDQDGTELMDVECRADVCRLELEHRDAETEQHFIEKFPVHVMHEFTETTVVHPEEGSEAPAVVYIARGAGGQVNN